MTSRFALRLLLPALGLIATACLPVVRNSKVREFPSMPAAARPFEGDERVLALPMFRDDVDYFLAPPVVIEVSELADLPEEIRTYGGVVVKEYLEYGNEFGNIPSLWYLYLISDGGRALRLDARYSRGPDFVWEYLEGLVGREWLEELTGVFEDARDISLVARDDRSEFWRFQSDEGCRVGSVHYHHAPELQFKHCREYRLRIRYSGRQRRRVLGFLDSLRTHSESVANAWSEKNVAWVAEEAPADG